MKLYSYFRSSAAYRVRIALNLKGLDYDSVPVHLVRGEHRLPGYTSINPSGLVPSLEDEGCRISQSLAIIEYLEERYPDVPVLPIEATAKARVRQFALTIACDIHPLNNLRVLKYLSGPLAVSEEQRAAWTRHWLELGLAVLERELATAGSAGSFCFGDSPGLADCCLIPQLFNARRFDVDLSGFPTLLRIETACNALDAFSRAHPSRQPDAE